MSNFLCFMAVQIWMSTALADVLRKEVIFISFLLSLKKSSTSIGLYRVRLWRLPETGHGTESAYHGEIIGSENCPIAILILTGKPWFRQESEDWAGQDLRPGWFRLPETDFSPWHTSRREISLENRGNSMVTRCVQVLIPFWCLSLLYYYGILARKKFDPWSE